MLALGCWLYRYRYPVIVAWGLALLTALPVAPRVFQALAPGGFSSDQLEAQRANDRLAERFGYDPSTLVLVFEDAGGGLTASDPRFLAEVDTALERVRGVEAVARVSSPRDNPRQVAPDGRAAYAEVALRADPGGDFRRVLRAVEGAIRPTPLKTTLTGSPVFYGDIYDVTEQDLRRAELISFPFAGLALLVVFGSVAAAVVPGVVGGAAVLITLAAMVLITRVVDLSIFSLNLTTMLGLGLGIDYSLFIVSRFREELARGHSVADSVARSLATAGRAVLFSGVTVFVGLLGLLLFDFNALRSLGIAGALVVAVCVLAALTLLPPVLGVLGPRIDAFPVRRLARGMARTETVRTEGKGLRTEEETTHPSVLSPQHSVLRSPSSVLSTPPLPASRFWSRLAHAVMAHPVATLVPVLALLLGLGSPFLRVQLGAPDASVLPPSVQSRQGFDLLRERWGEGELSPLLLVLQTTDGTSPLSAERVGALDGFVRALQADPRVERVDGLLSLDPRLSREQYQLVYGASGGDPARVADPYMRAAAQATVRGDTVVVQAKSRYGQTDERSKSLVRDIRATPPPAGFSLAVGGVTAGIVDYADLLFQQFPRAALFVVLATYAVLLLTFRSVLLPLKAILMNTLSILASYGALVVIFQEGALAGLLRFQPLGFVEASLPIVMFCVLFGLSMDYEVFLLTRVKEAYDAGADNRASVALGLEQSGRIITSAAAIVVLVSASFVTADIVLIKALGLGTAIAVFVDATIVRALLVPATMRLMGDWNWWAPAWLRRALPARGLHG